MKFEIEQNRIRKNTILSKINYALFGIFITSLVLAINIKLFNETGVITGLIANSLIVALGLYCTEPKTRLRQITWSILFTTVVLTTIGITFLQIIEKSLENL